MLISVIVPIYHGKKYLPSLIQLIEKCKCAAGNEVDVELILSNDAPEEKLEEYTSNIITINVLNTNINRGVQGARIEGIAQCNGEYILMLDQDDLIAEDYLKSQIENLEKKHGDASICKAINEKKPLYDTQNSFEGINKLEEVLKRDVCIVSPGQVLMKKSAVSNVWKTHIMEKRGADDWLLWICMLAEGKKFVLNDSILFEHIENGFNTSLNSYRMMQSDYEMLKILKETKTLSNEQLAIFENSINEFEKKRIQILDRFRKMFFTYDTWMRINTSGNSISEYLRKIGKTNICVYGIGYIGKALVRELKAEGINVLKAFDRNADYIEDIGVEISSQVEPVNNAEMVIVTLVENTEGICSVLLDTMGIPVITINGLFEDIQNS